MQCIEGKHVDGHLPPTAGGNEVEGEMDTGRRESGRASRRGWPWGSLGRRTGEKSCPHGSKAVREAVGVTERSWGAGREDPGRDEVGASVGSPRSLRWVSMEAPVAARLREGGAAWDPSRGRPGGLCG